MEVKIGWKNWDDWDFSSIMKKLIILNNINFLEILYYIIYICLFINVLFEMRIIIYGFCNFHSIFSITFKYKYFYL
jgi:hypothetical protein